MNHLPDFADNHFDLAIVDPPYGIGLDQSTYGSKKERRNGVNKYAPKDWNNKIPDGEYFDNLYRISKHQIIWGCNFYNKYIRDVGRIVWDKVIQNHVFSHVDIASCSKFNVNRIYRQMWVGFTAKEKDEERIHPTQKPVQLYRWLLKNYAKPGDLILDTHVGSGSSLVACIIEGFDYVGYEIDKEYYDGAMKRIRAEQSKIDMFAPVML